MKHKIFSYGTLQLPHIQLSLYGRELPRISITNLPGYKIGKLYFGQTPFPCLKEDKEALTYGSTYLLDDRELQATDDYETSAYTRKEVTLASGEKAWAYFENPDK